MNRIILLLAIVGCAPPTMVGLNEVGPTWVEVYNAGEAPASIMDWSLQLDQRTPWTIEVDAVVQPGDVRLLQGLNITAGVLTLRDEVGDRVEEVDVPELGPEESYGRTPDGDGRWQVFETPSPNALNGG